MLRVDAGNEDIGGRRRRAHAELIDIGFGIKPRPFSRGEDEPARMCRTAPKFDNVIGPRAQSIPSPMRSVTPPVLIGARGVVAHEKRPRGMGKRNNKPLGAHPLRDTSTWSVKDEIAEHKRVVRQAMTPDPSMMSRGGRGAGAKKNSKRAASSITCKRLSTRMEGFTTYEDM